MASLSELQYDVQPLAKGFFQLIQKYIPGLVVTSVYRSPVEQQRLYDQWIRGEKKDGLPVAKPGTSMHERRLAFDMARQGIPALTDPILPLLGYCWKLV